jgi:hypothetical protein
LRSSSHVQKHLAAAVDVQVVAIEEEVSYGLAQGSAAGIAAGDYFMALFDEPTTEQCRLSRFARAIAAIDREEHGDNAQNRLLY